MIAIGTALALVGIAHAQTPDQRVFPYEVRSHRLDNGLDVYFVPMESPGVVAYFSWVTVGSRDEVDPGRTGFAHFFEHLMFKGTERYPADVRGDLVMRMGLEDNAWTWFDETVYHAVFATPHLEKHIDMEADRFAHLRLTSEDVRKESGAVYGEYRKGQASPDQRLSEAVFAEAFQTHTYGHDTIGYEADIAAMPTAFEYSATFFDRFYRPENTNLLVVGDFDPDQALGWIEAAYKGWAPATTARPEIPVEPPQAAMRTVAMDWEAPTAPRLSLNWKIPGGDPDDPDVAALQVAADLLLSSVGPLERRLVREEGLAYQVSGGRGDFVDPCLFSIDVLAKDPADLERIEAIVREEIALLAKGVDAGRLGAARSNARYGFLTSLDEPAAVAEALGWAIRRGGSPDAIDRFYARYDAVTPDDIARVATTYLVDTGLTRGTLVSTAPVEE